MLNQGAGNWHVFTDDDASRRSNFRIRYRLAADGAWSAESAAKTVPLPEAVVLPAPGIAGTLADISAEQGTPALDVDAAAAFSGDELVFAVTGTGAEIDAGTGLLTISTDELRDAAEVVVTASNSGGSAEIRFQVDITAAAFVPVPPLMLAGPVLVGSAKVGTALTVETGSWGGDPAPGIACQWLRDGAPIEGAVGIEYLATAEDDLAEIACRVTATNAGGSAEALTAAVTVTHVAPSAKGELFEEILDEGTGPQEIPTAQDFEGEALTFAVTGADATIDAATGIVSIPTDSPVDGATVTVTASNSGGEAESSFLVTIEAIVVEEPEGPPAPPTAEEIGIGPSVFAPGGQSTTFRPNFTPTGRLTAANVEIGWSTSLQNPPVPTQIEGTIETATAGTYTLTHRDGDDSQWTLFREGNSRRTDFLRFRWRVAGGEWSDFGPVMVVPVPPARVIPPAPVGVSITPGSGDGKIIMAADPQTEWGDGEAGELKMWSSATGEVTFAAGIWQLPEKAFGQTINVKVYAVDSDGFKGEEVTENVLVPGDAPKVVNSWAMMHFSSQRAFDNQQTYRYGKSAHQIQFCHGGVRSEANPNDACFIMDVGGPWVTENAEDDWPMYQLAGCAGLEVKNSVSSMWDPDIAGRLVHAVGERPSWPWQTAGSRTGIYTSDDKGANFTLRHNVFAESEFSDTTTRSYRQVLNYAPTDHNIWYFLSPKYNLSRSTNRGSNWSVINSNVSAMGQCWYLQPDYGNANTLWIASENGLFKSTNGGASVFRVYPGGLPGGAVTHLCFDPDNANNWMAVVGGVGIYRTTNGGSSFSRLPTPTQFVCQVFQSRANKNYLWYMGINRTLDGQWGRSTGAFSTNGGASWQTCSVKGDTYGIDRGSPDLMRAEWSGSENGTRNMATVILPSPTDPDRAIATWGHALWRTKNGVHWDNASDGFSNHAGGDVNFGAMEWVGNDILFAAFDKRGFASRNNGDTWYQMGFQGALPGVPVGFTMSRHATKPKVLTTQGYYNPNPGTVLLSYDMGVNAANSKRPAFFSQNYGSNDFQKWAHFHKTGAPNVAYCTTAYSQDEGETWTKWVDRADSVYRNGVGEPSNRSSRAGVRMCSPQDNDWLIAAARSGRGMFLSKNRGLTWRKFTDNGPAEYGSDMASLWMDPTDKNIIYWWREGVGMARYDERTQSETIVPGTVQYKNMRVQRIRSSYQNGNHIYFFNRQDGKPMVFRSTTGWQGQFEDISGNLPRQTGNQGFEIDPNTGILWMNGVIGSRIFPPPGGHPRFDVLAKRSRT